MSSIPGPQPTPDGTRFTLWAPALEETQLVLPDRDERVPMERHDRGYFTTEIEDAAHGTRYLFATPDGDFPDPASRSQPDGVHGASEVVDFSKVVWTDAGFTPAAAHEQIFYELHVGTFTQEGTFAAAAERLATLADLGITSVELMPVSEFPGNRNWGYDGVYPYAADSSYGGPLELARFVDAAHGHGIAVVLDLVMNHFGPEGNYRHLFGPYVLDRYTTPWGSALNFDGPESDEVRRFFLGCLEHWMRACHIDGFRLDAIHEIHDESAGRFLNDVSRLVGAVTADTGKLHLLIAESGTNDRRVVLPEELGGLGMDAVWADDFHHTIHTLLTGEREGYYADFGSAEQVARTIARGWWNTGIYSPAHRRRHGSSPLGLPTKSFVFCTQNHDQTGNRMNGDRLVTLTEPAADRAAAALMLLAPYPPLLFMGQEYGETNPFLFFVDHTDSGLLQATRDGRSAEFAAFADQGTPPDPGSPDTFERSKLSWTPDADRWRETQELIAIRSRHDCFHPAGPDEEEVLRTTQAVENVIAARYVGRQWEALVLANLSGDQQKLEASDVMEVMMGNLRESQSVWSTNNDNWLEGARSGGAIVLEAYGVRAAVAPRRSEADFTNGGTDTGSASSTTVNAGPATGTRAGGRAS